MLRVVICIAGAMAAYGSLITNDLSMSMYGVNCIGQENMLFDCPLHISAKGKLYTQCNSNEAGVICQGNASSVKFLVLSTCLSFGDHVC